MNNYKPLERIPQAYASKGIGKNICDEEILQALDKHLLSVCERNEDLGQETYKKLLTRSEKEV